MGIVWTRPDFDFRCRQALSSLIAIVAVLSVSFTFPLPEEKDSLVADAGGPYESFEGEPITFNASASQAPSGVSLQYRWDFENDGIWDTPFSDSPTATHTWSDDHAGISTVEIQAKMGGVPSAIEIIGKLDGFSGINNDEQRAQSFVAEFDILTQVSVDISLGENRIPDDPVTLAIRSNLEGPDMATAQVDGTGMPGHMVENWVVFDIPDTALDVGKTYFSVLYSYPTNAPYELHGTLDAYPNGTAWGKGPGGGWVSSPAVDYRMILTGFNGLASATDEATVTVRNIAPTLEAFPSSLTAVEGDVVSVSSTARDRGSDDLTFTWSWEMGPTAKYTFPNDGTYPFTATDGSSHAYGDDGTYVMNLTVEDDDGGVVSKEILITVTNTAPSLSLGVTPSGNEGKYLTFKIQAIDPGSDDLTFSWWGQCDGWPSVSVLYPNDPTVGSDPFPSPDVNSRDVTDVQSVVCGDNGMFQWNVEVKDDDGGATALNGTFQVNNLPPSLTVSPPSLVQMDEGTSVTLDTEVSDPGSDDLTLTWAWDYGPTETRVFFNDGVGPDPPQSPAGEYPFMVSDSSTNTYGDDCKCNVVLRIEDDDGHFTEYSTEIVVMNVPPSIEGEVRAYAKGNLTLRVAGEKWHDVSLKLYEGDALLASASILREPGNPDEQSVTVEDVVLDLLADNFSALVEYTPLDDAVNGQVNGANPAWLVFTPSDGAVESRLHHTFNVKHPDTWIWRVEGFNAFLVGTDITFVATSFDRGSDDLTFNWDWGDGTSNTTTYYNDVLEPDPYPSPTVKPITVVDTQRHAFTTSGTYEVTLIVMDDDGGIVQGSYDLTL